MEVEAFNVEERTVGQPPEKKARGPRMDGEWGMGADIPWFDDEVRIGR